MRQTNSITRAHLQRLLLLGLCVSALLLLSALLVALRTVHQIDRNTQTFANRQSLAKAAIDGIEKQQAELNSRWLQLARRKDVVRREEILDQLDAKSPADERGARIGLRTSRAAAREHLSGGSWAAALDRLAVCGMRWIVSCYVPCGSCARRRLCIRRLEQQAGELTSLQYQFLETQENVARRFSHELHDELGQALTAVKANLSALRATADRGSRRRLSATGRPRHQGCSRNVAALASDHSR